MRTAKMTIRLPDNDLAFAKLYAKVLFNLNVLLDVIQRREPHFGAPAVACAMAVRKEVSGRIQTLLRNPVEECVGL